MSTQEAGCLCGKVRMTLIGEPDAVAVCHCLDCRKISGSTFSNNAIFKDENVKVTSGTPKQFKVTADAGRPMTNYFCGDCGTTLYRIGAAFPGKHVIKAGIVDAEDWPNKHTPGLELWAPRRVDWISQVKGAEQKDDMSG